MLAYFRDFVNALVNGIFCPHCQAYFHRKILTNSGYIMLDLIYVLNDSISICRHFYRFQGFLIARRKGEILPTFFPQKYPQAVDNLWINLGSYTNQLSICCLFRNFYIFPDVSLI